MANELRVRQNFLGGLIEDNPLSSGATAMSSAALAAMTVIGSTQHMAITLDPDGLYGEPEIAYVTAHTALATTATLVRGQEGTTARAHLRDIPWYHGPTTRDLVPDAFTNATLAGAWVAYGGGYGTPGYRKEPSGVTRLQGVAKDGALGSALFTLPAGYRPATDLMLPVMLGGNYAGLLVITTAGVVTPFQGGGPVGTNAFVALDGITFPATQ